MQKQPISPYRDEANWEADIKATIPSDLLAHFRDHAVKELTREAKIDGFRPGHAPESAIVRAYGEQIILEHAAELAVKDVLPEILAEQKLNIIDSPKVTVSPPRRPIRC